MTFCYLAKTRQYSIFILLSSYVCLLKKISKYNFETGFLKTKKTKNFVLGYIGKGVILPSFVLVCQKKIYNVLIFVLNNKYCGPVKY